MISPIRFGTDGWRGVIAREFVFDRVEIVAQAIADYVKERGLESRGLIVGYDARFLSEQFAQTVAEVLTANQIPVWIFDRDGPTPAAAFHILHHRAAGAVMLTASHNPPEYHGIKYLPEYASPAFPDVTERIESFVRELESGKRSVPRSLNPPWPRPDAGRQSPVPNPQSFDPRPDYLDHLARVIDMEAIRRAKLRVEVDCLHAVARGYLDEMLRRAGCEVAVYHEERNPLFGNLPDGGPDTSERNLKPLAEAVVRDRADLGLACDGDGDRFGVIDRTGRYLTANQVIALVLWHVRQTRAPTGSVARTVATTHLVDAIAHHFGLGVQETPVGFKYIGQALRETDAIVGGEESGGLSIKGHIPEKDGILACLLAAEIVARSGHSLSEVLEEIQQTVGYFVTRRLDIHLVPEAKDALMQRLRENPPTTLAGRSVMKAIDIDGVKLICDDGSWLLARPSGTEPLVRVYVEAHSEERVAHLVEEAQSLVNSL